MTRPSLLLRLRIAPRMVLLILLGTGVILAAVTLSDYRSARRMLEEELRSKARHLAISTARNMEVIQKAVEKVVAEMAVALSARSYDTEQVFDLLEDTVEAHEEIFGAAVVIHQRDPPGAPPSPVAPGPAPGAPAVQIPYVYHENGLIVRKDLAAGGYPYETLDWYQLPKEMGTPIWTEPYYDEGGADSIMVTYSVPLRLGPAKEFRGIVTGDLALDWLEETLARIQIEEGGKAFILSRNGRVMSHWRREWVMRESIFSIAEAARSPEMRRVGQCMIRGEEGFVEFPSLEDESPRWLVYTPIPGTGWSLGAVFEKSMITARILDLGKHTLLLAGLGSLAMLVVALLIARSISRPIGALEEAARALAGGNLGAPLPAPRGNDEVARLTDSFAHMRDDLTRYIEDLQETTAAKVRIEDDLRTARTIQLDLLPSRFAFDPPRPEIDLHAVLQPARAVGGDFYDFFFVGRDRIFVAVGDVSGKGVPAAIFMAVSKAYLKAFARQTGDPATAISQLNDELAQENDEAMFLTVFCAEIDLRTGEGQYANGGHNPPLVLRASGRIDELPVTKGPLVGLDPGKSFERGAFRLDAGDLLLGFSDGLVDAENEEGLFYGDARIQAILSRLGGLEAKAALERIQEDVRSFVGQAAQSDDITLLALRYAGPQAPGD